MEKRENTGEEDIIKIEEIDELAKKNIELHLETNRNRFYLVKSCINKFYNAYQKLNPENSDENTELVGDENRLKEIAITIDCQQGQSGT